jgi:hypothetical protein
VSGGCGGLHCGGCGKGGSGSGGGAALAGIIAAIVIGYVAVAAVKAVAPAVDEAFHVIAVIVQVVLIATASAVGLAVLAGVTWAGVRMYRRQAVLRDSRNSSRIARVAVQQLPVVVHAQVIPPDPPPAIAPPGYQPNPRLVLGAAQKKVRT